VSHYDVALARAQAFEQSAEFAQAERIYEQILRGDPLLPVVWHRLGLVHVRQGKIEQAVEPLGRAVSLDSSNAAFQSDLGTLYRELGRIDEAIDYLQQAVQLAPADAQVQYALGAALQQRQDPIGAKLRFQQAVRLRPEFAEAWNDLGIVHQWLGELDESGACFERLIAIVPELSGAHFNLGNVRLAQGRLLDSIACYARAIERQPRSVEALNNLGTALHKLGRVEQARHAYETALKMQPSFVDARINLGALLNFLGRTAQAEACFREALAIDPRSIAAYNNLAGVLQSQLHLDDAERLLREALRLDPGAVDALGNLANVLTLQGRMDEAGECYRRAIEFAPHPRLRIHAATMLPPIYQSVDEIELGRENLKSNIARLLDDGVRLDPTEGPIPVNFLVAYHGFNDCELARTVARLYAISDQSSADSFPGSAWERTAMQALPAVNAVNDNGPISGMDARQSLERSAFPGRAWERGGKFRIGFLSKFLRDHTIGDLLKGIIHNLSRTDFEVTVFLVGDVVDETVTFLRASADQFICLPEDVAAARQIVADAGLDVLFYPDVGMDPTSSALAFSRLALVQCTTWGHPVTTGFPTMDYFISSKLIEPAGAAAHYSEKLVVLDSLPAYYYRPEAIANDPQPTETISRQKEAARREFGLPRDASIYLCPQSLFKFHPDFDAILGGILGRDPAARVVLIEAPHAHWTEMLRDRLRRNLSGLSYEVTFVPRVGRAAFLRLLTTADVVLDPLHFGGGNTSFQALGLGLPIVTLPSELMRGRVTAGCYRKMEFETCIAQNAGEYVDLAVRLGTDPEFNSLVRSQIASRSHLLFEDPAAVRELEEFFRTAIRGTSVSHTLTPRPAAA
jgi:predicted O-linked N-acetylglucosamine transferase (SPINDLY family)